MMERRDRRGCEVETRRLAEKVGYLDVKTRLEAEGGLDE